MPRFLMLMHADAVAEEDLAAWGPYLGGLRLGDRFDGGSSLGPGRTSRKSGSPGSANDHLVGYLIVHAGDIEAARDLLDGNPVYEAGGTIEFRELTED